MEKEVTDRSLVYPEPNIQKTFQTTRQRLKAMNMQERIQVYFDSVQPLWMPKKTAQIFLQVQINNRIFR